MTDRPRGAREGPGRGGVAAGIGYSLVGQGAPLAVAYFAIPLLAHALGAARFGLLTLAWAVLGYFSLFDLGLGRALTQAVASRLATGHDEEIPPLVWTGLAMMLALGAAGALVAALVAPWLAGGAFNVPPELRGETLAAFRVLALAIPVVIVSAAVRGVLEALQRFDLVNAVRVPQGVFSFAGPVLVLPLSRSLAVITAVLLAGRFAGTVAWYALMLRELPSVRRVGLVDRASAAALLRLGSWMTVSNAVSPLMVTLDRFVIAAVATVAAVAYYTAPWEAVTKLWIFPTAVATVLFPAFTTARAAGAGGAGPLYLQGLKATTLVLLPVVVVAEALAPELLGAWLGPDYAARSAVVLRWLAAGVLVNGVAQIPVALVHGSGRPDVTAKLHLVELPIYLAALWWLVGAYGIAGAAAAWTLRATVDAVALLACAQRVAPLRWTAVRGTAVTVAAAAAGAAAIAGSGAPVRVKGALAAGLVAGSVLASWWLALTPAERHRAWRFATAGRSGARRAVANVE